MKILVIAVLALVVLVGIIFVIGTVLPKSHVATGSAHFKAPPQEIWKIITDYKSFAQWRPDVKSIEPLTTTTGLPGWKEIGSNGSIPIETMVQEAPHKLVTRIADTKLPFGGTWTYELSAKDGGTVLAITENGEVYNPFFRFMSKFVFGQTTSINNYLKALSGKHY